MHTNPAPDAHSDDLSLGDLLALLWTGRWILLGCAFTALSLSSFYAWRATPIYQVDAMLQIEPKKGGSGRVSALAAVAAVTDDPFGVLSEAQAETEILRSNMVLGRAVDALRLDLLASPVRSRLFGSALSRGRKEAPAIELETLEVPRSASYRLEVTAPGAFTWKDEEGLLLAQGKVGEEITANQAGQPLKLKVQRLVGAPGQEYRLARLHTLEATDALRGQLQVSERGKQTNILGLSYQHPDPARGAEILNAVLNQYVRQNIERKAEEASKTLAFLQEQMPLLRGKLEVAEEKMNQYRVGSRSADLSEEAKLVLKQSVDLEAQTLALRQKKEELLRTYQERSDVVSTLDQQIGKLQGETRRLEGQVKNLPKTQQEVLRLMRDVQVNQELYTALMNNVQQLQVAKAGEVGNARIVDHATPSLHPVKPRRQTIVALGTLLGLFAGVGLVMLRRALHHGVENPQVLESALGLPVLVTIPHSRQQDGLRATHSGDLSLLATTHPEDLAVESLRSLRTSLHFTLVDSPSRVIMVAGPAPQIGKSFVSANFAGVLAQGGARVLLIDGDLRKGKLHRLLGCGDRSKGLSEILSGQLDWQMALREVGGIHLIATGALPPNPAELLMGPRLGGFLQEAATFFDYILIDTPPVLAVTDAMIVGAHAGAVLLALKSGAHPLDEVKAALQRLDNAGIKPKGIVFNDVQPLSARYGYHRYAYHYGYQR